MEVGHLRNAHNPVEVEEAQIYGLVGEATSQRELPPAARVEVPDKVIKAHDSLADQAQNHVLAGASGDVTYEVVVAHGLEPYPQRHHPLDPFRVQAQLEDELPVELPLVAVEAAEVEGADWVFSPAAAGHYRVGSR